MSNFEQSVFLKLVEKSLMSLFLTLQLLLPSILVLEDLSFYGPGPLGRLRDPYTRDRPNIN